MPITFASAIHNLHYSMRTAKQKVTALKRGGEEGFYWNGKRLRSLFDNMAEGFTLYETVESEDTEKQIDFRFVEVNAAFEKLTGLKRKKVLHNLRGSILQGRDARFTKIYSEVAKSGIPVHFTDYSKKKTLSIIRTARMLDICTQKLSQTETRWYIIKR